MGKTPSYIEKIERFGAHNYLPLPVVLERGQGSRVWDVEGKEYLDFLACYSALNFGHQHPRMVRALTDQLGRLANCSRAFHNDQLCLFSEELVTFVGLDAALLMNSGAEAVETAVKMARKWGYENKGIPDGKAKIIVMRNNFHGRTLTVISFSTEASYRKGFSPFTPGFEVVDFGDIGQLEAAIDENTVAVLMEPIQAEAGILLPPAGYLNQVRRLCDSKGVLMMLDEIQTGLGRTGRDFCYQRDDVLPDVVILGKSLGGGLLPLSAVVARKDVMDVMGVGTHGSTFGGNPLACAVGREAIRMLKEERLSERAERLGQSVKEALAAENLPRVKEVRGRGMLIGIDMEPVSARPYCELLAERGVLCKETHEYVIRIAPPLVIEEGELKEGVGRIVEVIKELGR